jgi:beta-barrel assembly-enhancing protease
MEKEVILYFNGISARATNVRVLLFNESVNLYDEDTNDLIASYQLKGTSMIRAGDNYYVYFDGSGSCYLQFHNTHEIANTMLEEIGKSNDGWMKKIMRQKVVVLAGVAVILIAGIYLLLITLIPILGSAVISRDVEVSMGDKLKQVLLREEEVVGSTIDSAGTVKLQSFANRLRLSDNYLVRVTLVNSPIVNAYALPGGHIIVYTGMLEKIHDPESLVALLAHEASHVNERHSLRSLLRSTANAIIVSVIFNDASGITATIVGNAQTLNGLKYSRAIETEADEDGMQLMIRNGIDASGMKRLMQVLEKEGDVPERLSFLSSHPLRKERIEAANRFIKHHPQNVTTNNDLQTLFEELRGVK